MASIDNDWELWNAGNISEIKPEHPNGYRSITGVENNEYYECPICFELFDDDWEFEEHVIDESREQPKSSSKNYEELGPSKNWNEKIQSRLENLIKSNYNLKNPQEPGSNSSVFENTGIKKEQISNPTISRDSFIEKEQNQFRFTCLKCQKSKVSNYKLKSWLCSCGFKNEF